MFGQSQIGSQKSNSQASQAQQQKESKDGLEPFEIDAPSSKLAMQESNSDAPKAQLKELKEWLKPLNTDAHLDVFLEAVDKLDNDYSAQAEKNRGLVKQLKKDFNEKLEKMLDVLKKHENSQHEFFGELFGKINNSKLLNIHRNPRTDAFFKITKPTKKQEALGMVRHVALWRFERKMKGLLNHYNTHQSALGDYRELERTISQAMKSDLFSLQRANWPVMPTKSSEEIAGILVDVTRAIENLSENLNPNAPRPAASRSYGSF